MHLNGKDNHSNHKIINPNSITEATIKGFADWDYLNRKVNNVRDFGKGPAKYHDYNGLLGINRLLNKLVLVR